MSHESRIRVTHILTKPELGGAQANTLYTVRHLDRRRFAPALVTSPQGPLAAEMAALEDTQVTFVPELVSPIRPLTDWVAMERLVAILRQSRPHIVHTHSSKAGLLGRVAARRAGVPVVIHSVHGFPFHDWMSAARRTFYWALERGAARLTDQFICVARSDIKKGVQAGIFTEEHVQLIRSGIPLEPFRQAKGLGAAVRQEMGIPAKAPLVAMVACLKPQKDPLAFVEMAARVLEQVPEAWFLLVGDGKLRAQVMAARRRLGLGERLHLAGWRRDIPAVMDALDVLVLTSLHEGLPRVVPEAMARGRAVVATAVDGTPEAITEGETGCLVAPGDIDGMARRVTWLLQDPLRGKRLGEAASKQVGEFDIDDMVRRQEQLYDGLMARRKGDAA
ncbi:MAG: glycosyltransferase family 4 protein [Acidobacteria bacterium]|nr:glycosyltransferase family 4 protein [Acidobacteriota bacterium]